jgi:hypothetical protein
MTPRGQPPSPSLDARRHLAARTLAFVAASSLRRVARSSRSRFVLLGVALFDAAVIAVLVKVLTPWFGTWGPDGGVVLERRLWLSCLASGVGSFGLAMLVAVEDGFGPRAILAFTFPLPASTRFRILYGNLAFKLANLWIIGSFGFGIAVVSALGSQGAAWLMLLLALDALAVLGSILLVSAWLLCFEGTASRVSVIGAALLTAGAVLGARWKLAAWTVPPLVATAAALTVVVVGLGPLGGALGGLYARAFYVTQGSAPRVVKRRTIGLVTGWLLRFRSPGVALFVKDVLTRSRHWANWGRVVFAAIAVLAFPLLREKLQFLAIDDSLLIAAFVVGGVLATIIDGASSPFGSEGNRLALLLTIPIRRSDIVRAKMTAFVVPMSTVAVATSAWLSLATGLDLLLALHVCLAVLLMVVGISAVFVLGSVFDVDLDLEIQGGLQGLLYEETPFSPVRLALTAFGIGLCAVDLVILAHVPAAAVHPLLLALDALLLGAGLRVATSRLDTVQSRR